MAIEKLKLVPFRALEIPKDVNAAVHRVLDENMPFLMVARHPDGKWEISMFLTPTVSRYEAVGAVFQAQLELINQDQCDDGDGNG